jgi:nucleoside-diphosphate-sugar epimerase
VTRTALVTGAAGFVGRHTVAELEKQGWDVRGCDSSFGPDRRMRDFNDVVRWNTTQYDLVIHAAAVAPHRAAIDGQPHTFAKNMRLDATLFDWAIQTKQKRVLYISSSAAYPIAPQNDLNAGWENILMQEDEIDLQYPELADGNYGITKLTGEHLSAAARAAGVPVTVVRPFSGYGEDQGTDWPFGAFVQRIQRGDAPFVIWGSSMQQRDWIHISDVVKGMLAIADANDNGIGEGEPVNLCTGIGTSMNDLALLMMNAAGQHIIDIEVDYTKPMGVMNRVGDSHRFFEYYEPKVTIEEGVYRALGRKDV